MHRKWGMHCESTTIPKRVIDSKLVIVIGVKYTLKDSKKEPYEVKYFKEIVDTHTTLCKIFGEINNG